MADNTKIEWTEATWNVINGCSVVSPGCTNCYAMRLAGTRMKSHPTRAGLVDLIKAGPVWNGSVIFNGKILDQPLRWRKPRKVFVCAHGDLFHENVPDEWIDRVFAVMALAPQHTFQVLTKRAGRMREYMARTGLSVDYLEKPARHLGRTLTFERVSLVRWPLPNVWLGVSCEDQKRADERIPHLLETPAAVRWVSAEPLLGPIDFGEIGALPLPEPPADTLDSIDWVVAGGESGPNARPAHPDWFRSLRDQCQAAGVPFFFKQWGAWKRISDLYVTKGDIGLMPSGHQKSYCSIHDVGCHTMRRVGKRAAGRLLDGREWSEYPEAQ